MMETPQRELHDYVADISEHTDVRAGSPLRLGIQETGGGANFALLSRRASRIRLELFAIPKTHHPHGQSIWTRQVLGLAARTRRRIEP